MIEEPQTVIVNNVFGMASLLSRIRDDVTQGAWLALISRRSTKWDNAEKLQSQARNALADERRTMARRYAFDKRITLSGLLWEAMEDRFPVVDCEVKVQSVGNHTFTIRDQYPAWFVACAIGTTGKLLSIIQARKRERSKHRRGY